jgi:phosphotransferase system HPr (HPr) family protein
MKPQNITVTCEHGLPLSVASQVSAIARKSGLAVTIQCEDCPQIDACSVFQMLSLGASEGTVLEIGVDAPDDVKAGPVLRALAEVFEHGAGI